MSVLEQCVDSAVDVDVVEFGAAIAVDYCWPPLIDLAFGKNPI